MWPFDDDDDDNPFSGIGKAVENASNSAWGAAEDLVDFGTGSSDKGGGGFLGLPTVSVGANGISMDLGPTLEDTFKGGVLGSIFGAGGQVFGALVGGAQSIGQQFEYDQVQAFNKAQRKRDEALSRAGLLKFKTEEQGRALRTSNRNLGPSTKSTKQASTYVPVQGNEDAGAIGTGLSGTF